VLVIDILVIDVNQYIIVSALVIHSNLSTTNASIIYRKLIVTTIIATNTSKFISSITNILIITNALTTDTIIIINRN